MIASKFGQLFFLVITGAVGFFVFGVDVVFTENNIFMLAKADAGIIFEKSGFLVRVNDNWIGIAKVHEGMVDMPVATWFVIGGVLTALWMILFDWNQHSE